VPTARTLHDIKRILLRSHWLAMLCSHASVVVFAVTISQKVQGRNHWGLGEGGPDPPKFGWRSLHAPVIHINIIISKYKPWKNDSITHIWKQKVLSENIRKFLLCRIAKFSNDDRKIWPIFFAIFCGVYLMALYPGRPRWAGTRETFMHSYHVCVAIIQHL